ncbi:MAG TPA: hypothetical protein VJ023_12290 [Pyrinomonadaceae bacterium]|nr:hypothetical protein [Pyrinomonadaceae bacterium]
MITFAALLSVLCYGWMAGCCLLPQNPRAQPKRPESVRGWKEAEFGGVHSVAELVLNKGESSHNSNVGIQVIDVIRPERCAEPSSYLGSPRVVLRFYRPSDGLKLCEATFIEGGSGLDSPTCDKEFEIAAISINAINSDDGWVWFDLRTLSSAP